MLESVEAARADLGFKNGSGISGWAEHHAGSDANGSSMAVWRDAMVASTFGYPLELSTRRRSG